METQYKDVRAALVGQGDYQLCPSFKKFEIGIEVWASQPKERRDKHFMRFMKKLSLVEARTVVSSDGRRIFTGPGKSGGKKPHQRKRRRTAKTASISKH